MRSPGAGYSRYRHGGRDRMPIRQGAGRGLVAGRRETFAITNDDDAGQLFRHTQTKTVRTLERSI